MDLIPTELSLHCQNQVLHEALCAVRSRLGRPASDILGTTPIYCVSLPKDEKRRIYLSQSAKDHHLNIRFTPGVLTAPPKVSSKNKVVTPYRIKHHGTIFELRHSDTSLTIDVTYARLGCMIAHALTLKTFLDDTHTDSPYALIIEDDVDFDLIPYWPTTLATYVAGAPADWEILQLQYSNRVMQRTLYENTTEHRSGTFLYCITRKAAQRFWTKHTNGGDKVFRFSPDRVKFPGNVIADRYLYRFLKTYRNSEFPAITFSNGTSHLNNGTGGLDVSVKLASEVATNVLRKLAQTVESGPVHVVLWIPGAPLEVWVRANVTERALQQWTWKPIIATRIPEVAWARPSEPLPKKQPKPIAKQTNSKPIPKQPIRPCTTTTSKPKPKPPNRPIPIVKPIRVGRRR